MCRCVPRNPALIALILFPSLLFASTKHQIAVFSASTQKSVVLVNAGVGNTHFQLECFLSDPTCQIPNPGQYIAIEARAADALYQDCYNIDLYDLSVEGGLGRLIGTYCLLGDEAESKLIDPKN